MRWIAFVTIMILGGCVWTGCGMITPTTEVRGGQSFGSPYFELKSTKDESVSLNKATYNPETKEIEIEGLEINSASSPVIRENVQQMLAFVEQQRAANEGISIAMTGIANILSSLVPMVDKLSETLKGSIISVDTPYGGGSATLGSATTSATTETDISKISVVEIGNKMEALGRKMALLEMMIAVSNNDSLDSAAKAIIINQANVLMRAPSVNQVDPSTTQPAYEPSTTPID